MAVRTLLVYALAIGLALAMPGCGRSHGKARNTDAAANATAIHPVLIGTTVPSLVLWTPEGKQAGLSALLARKPTLLVVYKGNWCMYCQKQLSDLQKIEPDLLALGYQIVAVSPDSPAALKKTAQDRALNYQLLSDQQHQAIVALGLAYYVDAEARREMERHGVSLDAMSSQPQWMLPVPAVFLIDTSGRIRWEYVNPDYRERVPPEVLLAAAKALAEKK